MNENDELLVVRRKNAPAKGTLDLPGGFADPDETAEEGVAREVKEETGLDVISTDYLFSLPNRYEYSGMTIPTLDLFFVCKVRNANEATALDDASESMWMKLDDILFEEFGLASVKKGLMRFVEMKTKSILL